MVTETLDSDGHSPQKEPCQVMGKPHGELAPTRPPNNVTVALAPPVGAPTSSLTLALDRELEIDPSLAPTNPATSPPLFEVIMMDPALTLLDIAPVFTP